MIDRPSTGFLWMRVFFQLRPSMVYYIAYVSSATHLFPPEELVELLAKSRANNARAGISGMLVYRDGNFMQVLEGEEDAVRAQYDKIERDTRHAGVLTLLEGYTSERQFPGWSMAFRDLDTLDAKSLPGYDEFLNLSTEGKEFSRDPSRCQRLLLSFKAHMR